MIILNTLESYPDPESIRAWPPLPRDPGGPVFAEPWQATAFALVVRLSAAGYFMWEEWAFTLAEELKNTREPGEPDDNSQGPADSDLPIGLQGSMADAFRDKPHGQPVELKTDDGG